jgi:DNA-binding GntR family transcriptional regulator
LLTVDNLAQEGKTSETNKTMQVNTLQEEAICRIKQLIIEGDLKLGQRVNEVEIANLLNISRGPIRESLRILNHEGLVTYIPRKGMFVTQLERKDIHEIYDIRFYLEKCALETGYRNLTKEKIGTFYSMVDEMVFFSKENQKDRLVRLDQEFHALIIGLAGYPRLRKNWESYQALIELIFSQVFLLGSERVQEVPENHRLLVQTLEKGDIHQSIQALEEHYLTAKDKLLMLWTDS